MAYGDYPDLSNIKRVLVIKLRHLGDVLLTTPVFSLLKKRLPNAEIDAYIYKEAVPMLEGHKALSNILFYDRAWKGNLLKELQMLLRLRKQRYDLVINLTEGDRGAMAARISGARVRVGIDARKVYTHVAKSCPSLRHTVERNLDVLRRIGLFPELDERELFFHIPTEARSKVPKGRYLLIHPASRWRFKCWSIDKMRQLTERLLAKGEQLVFTSGPDPVEVAMVEEIAQGLNVTNLAGKISPKELGALIEQTACLICVDSVPFHLASALKAPVIALFGPTSEITWGPWQNPNARIITETMSCRPCYRDGCGGSKRSDCLERLSVERVLLELESFAEVKTPRLRMSNEFLHSSR